mmetsp:Transcript_2525/g.4450  ORF Transcript_2525/g.4450 Transcript_2525/m.4450 type:complete len:457 (-) Transcript_2525:1340-2710(-)
MKYNLVSRIGDEAWEWLKSETENNTFSSTKDGIENAVFLEVGSTDAFNHSRISGDSDSLGRKLSHSSLNSSFASVSSPSSVAVSSLAPNYRPISKIDTVRMYIPIRYLTKWIAGVVFGTSGSIMSKLFESARQTHAMPRMSRFLANRETGEYLELVQLENGKFLLNEVLLFHPNVVQTYNYVLSHSVIENGIAEVFNSAALQNTVPCDFCPQLCQCPVSFLRRRSGISFRNRNVGDFLSLFVHSFSQLSDLQIKRFDQNNQFISHESHLVKTHVEIGRSGEKLQRMKRLYVNMLKKNYPGLGIRNLDCLSSENSTDQMRIEPHESQDEMIGMSISNKRSSSEQSSHSLTDHEGRLHQCELCSLKFSTRSHLTAHVNCVHLCLRLYPCHTCDAAFGSLGNLNRHVRAMHQNMKPFECEVCRRSFVSRDKLVRHNASVLHEKRLQLSRTSSHNKQKYS